jgi:hypothetical protein
MKITRIVIVSLVLFTATTIVGGAGERPVGPAVIRVAGCCDFCPPICPNPPNPPNQTN